MTEVTDVEAPPWTTAARADVARDRRRVTVSVPGKVEIGVPHGIAARLDEHTSTGRVRNNLSAPDASEQSDRIVAVRARGHGGDIVVRRATRRR